MRVHPVADLFPMMSEDELNDLAADIKANGQIHPIIITHEEADEGAEEILIDGRNRWRACEIAGVEPQFEKLNGHDPVAFILSNNVARRHMMKGALAMACAKAYPEAEEVRGRGKVSGHRTLFPMVDKRRLSESRTVIAYASELVDDVLHGRKSLDESFATARQRKAERATTEEKMARLRAEATDLAEAVTEERSTVDAALAVLERRNADEALLVTIQTDAPDLVALVREGRMSVSDALAASDERKRQAENARQGATSLLADVITTIGGLIDMADSPEQAGEKLMKNFDQALFVSSRGEELTAARLTACAAMLAECSKQFKRNKVTGK